MTALGVVTLAQDNVNTIGLFEQDLPAYWTKGSEPSGSSLSWAKDEFVGTVKSSIAGYNPGDKMKITAWIK